MASGESREYDVRADRGFFAKDPARLARDLLGMVLVRVLEDGERLAGLVVETEAYGGAEDLGSHARGGRRTPRNESMYAAPGTAYVYFTYGMHHCMNLVGGKVDVPCAALIRAIEPCEGIDRMRLLRGTASGGRPRPVTDLGSGPGKLCRALSIDRALDGTDMVTSGVLYLEYPARRQRGRVRRTARIGLGDAGAWTHKPLRWFLSGNPHVSRGRPSG
ncbi:MAG TPA: DNA-3-methyladenine glycosylase [Phycisphaerales bacterium]|nr:DNA-3-methyladenine glycosylase [Phycisphaerae bacterium]HRJ50421.1 DNA-3-methyladenine glycosylase [Phycisphaerales bacterium]